jgi:hypothetical protein
MTTALRLFNDAFLTPLVGWMIRSKFELERMWKEAVLGYFMVGYYCNSEGTGEYHEKPSSSDWNSKSGVPEYEVGMLTTRPVRSFPPLNKALGMSRWRHLKYVSIWLIVSFFLTWSVLCSRNNHGERSKTEVYIAKMEIYKTIISPE